MSTDSRTTHVLVAWTMRTLSVMISQSARRARGPGTLRGGRVIGDLPHAETGEQAFGAQVDAGGGGRYLWRTAVMMSSTVMCPLV